MVNEPIDALLNSFIIGIQIQTATIPTNGYKAIPTPPKVATPYPPFIFRVIGKT